MLEITNLSKRFGDKTVLAGIDLTFADGEMVGVIGRSGAGKSTLLRLINRLTDPSGGDIVFTGKPAGNEEPETIDVTHLKGRALQAWRARCAMIFQQFNLVGRLDVLTNVLTGRLYHTGTLPSLFLNFSDAERAHALQLLDRFGLIEIALQRADTLSGGQQQRVAIARALAQEPDILLADEAIASLDPASAETVMKTLRSINRNDGITVICNLHALDTARSYCDRIVGLAVGRVVYDGPAQALSKADAQAIYGSAAAEETGAAA